MIMVMVLVACFASRLLRGGRRLSRLSLRFLPSQARLYSFRNPISITSLSSTDSYILQDGTNASSSFAEHVLVQQPGMTIQDLVQQVLQETRLGDDREQQAKPLNATELIDLGAVWFLPAVVGSDGARSSAWNASESLRGVKPTRLSLQDCDKELSMNDYLRIHSNPRRFPQVYQYDWSKSIFEDGGGDGNDHVVSIVRPEGERRPRNNDGIVVAADTEKGWMVIDKPLRVPVHATVDNAKEMVAHMLQQSLQRRTSVSSTVSLSAATTASEPYVSTPQRLDQNTTGLLVIATSKPFARYYAQLLRDKTHAQLLVLDNGDVDPRAASSRSGGEHNRMGGIHKLYRCLVCLIPPSRSNSHVSTDGGAKWSVNQAASELEMIASKGRIVRHFLEPSIRAPKRFVSERPEDDGDAWKESLLKVIRVGQVCTLVGNKPAKLLADRLWESGRRPPECQAVVELEIELLTGRTHQIRGQLAAEGFPLVGDAQYGGSIPHEMYPPVDSADLDRLALQCCELEFLDPDVPFSDNDDNNDDDDEKTFVVSSRWNRFRLDSAWWTELLDEYQDQSAQLSAEDTTTLASDVGLLEAPPSNVGTTKQARPELLPPRVDLSDGKNKYVLVRATHPHAEVEWFVKSAKPAECGGLYHGNIAQDLREWIQAAGYKAKVTGGGRIDYSADEQQALVYGFSYGFGRGDHERAAALIRKWSQGGINATVDNSPDLY